MAIEVVLRHLAVGRGKLSLSVEYIIDPADIHKANATPDTHLVNALCTKINYHYLSTIIIL